MPMKLHTLILFLGVAILAGCDQAPSAKQSATGPADTPAKAELSDKLNKMSPQERAAYVQAHPDEVKRTFSGAQAPGAENR